MKHKIDSFYSIMNIMFTRHTLIIFRALVFVRGGYEYHYQWEVSILSENVNVEYHKNIHVWAVCALDLML